MPAVQTVQFNEPSDENEPAAQLAQPAAEIVPLPVTAPKKPGAQVVQAATEVLPVAESVVKVPAGHEVQLAAPAAA